MYKIVALLLLLLCFSCYEAQRDCKEFQTGTFEFETLVGTELMKSTFVRNDTMEIDYFNQKIDTFSIRWTNECEYVMQKLHPKNQAEKEPVKFRILSTTKDQYTFEYSMVIPKKNRKNVVKTGTVTKISSNTSI
jgi:hypothetical protein